jgi:putative cro repressor
MSNDYSKLLGRIAEKCGTQAEFADALKMSERSVSRKLNNVVAWKDSEILKAAEVLEIETENIPDYFFKYQPRKT